ncbi:hypothetical protein [Pseudomaricurvus alcaniphilus]|nr:hypothetical protein [Pseudomaricurvus alcaniphilus]
MNINPQAFEWLVYAAVLITCTSPCVLVGLLINDYLKGKLW